MLRLCLSHTTEMNRLSWEELIFRSAALQRFMTKAGSIAVVTLGLYIGNVGDTVTGYEYNQ